VSSNRRRSSALAVAKIAPDAGGVDPIILKPRGSVHRKSSGFLGTLAGLGGSGKRGSITSGRSGSVTSLAPTNEADREKEYFGKVQEDKQSHDDILMLQNFSLKGRKSSLTYGDEAGDTLRASPEIASRGAENSSSDLDKEVKTGSEREKAMLEANIPSLVAIRKNRASRGGESRKNDIFGKTRSKSVRMQAATTSMRTVGCQHGTPRLETRKVEFEGEAGEEKCSVDVGIEFKRKGRKTKGRSINTDSGALSDLPYLDDVADGVLKEIEEGSMSPKSKPRRSFSPLSPKRNSLLPMTRAKDVPANEYDKSESKNEANSDFDSERALEYDEDEDEDEEVHVGQAGSMFQGLGEAVVAKDFHAKFHVGWKIQGRNLLNSASFSTMVGITTVYAIVGMEIAEAVIGSRDFLGLHLCSFFSLLFFTFEIVLSCLCIEHYNLSFFFW
jgi:hypothetical protein